jgi:hypothetical protein
MPTYTFLHNLLNVLLQIANKMGLWKNTKKHNCSQQGGNYTYHLLPNLKALTLASQELH